MRSGRGLLIKFLQLNIIIKHTSTVIILYRLVIFLDHWKEASVCVIFNQDSKSASTMIADVVIVDMLTWEEAPLC